MSEDDRAAKAARAKAMLKKRQQKKSVGGGTFTPADSDAKWIESLSRLNVLQPTPSGTLSTPPPAQASTSPHKAPEHTTGIASASVFSSNGEALETGARFQLKKLEEEESALQLRLDALREGDALQLRLDALREGGALQLRLDALREGGALQLRLDALRRVGVMIQETRSLENMYRSSQVEILQLKSQCDELRRSHAELQAENVQSNKRHVEELDDQRHIANSHKEEAKKLSDQLVAARAEIQNLDVKVAESPKKGSMGNFG
ncbi:putative protein 67 [Rhizopogon vesiculosus]|uniref:Uncharacterized protein n=1 Tax=Rhizopogon vesiculosus TaxID=180088 RepID=A0A1J8PJV9_9AGAM|nr:putative protein 67 [Rhizopogon vesiculosus]